MPILYCQMRTPTTNIKTKAIRLLKNSPAIQAVENKTEVASIVFQSGNGKIKNRSNDYSRSTLCDYGRRQFDISSCIPTLQMRRWPGAFPIAPNRPGPMIVQNTTTIC
jgi:hypothetical protein